MADQTYRLGESLPPQRVLATEFGVSRDTVQRVMGQLADEGWITTKQGSGSRVIRQAPPVPVEEPRAGAVSLPHFIAEAFEQPEVVLDVFTLSSESLDAHIRLQVERIRAGEIRPKRVALRMLLPSLEQELAYPRAKGNPEDPRLQQRLRDITRRCIASLQDAFLDLRSGLVESASLEVRHVALTPSFKLYLLNGAVALFAPYRVIERQISLHDNTDLLALDVLGFGAALTAHVRTGDEESPGSVFMDSMQEWFDSLWDLLAETGRESP